MKHQRPIIHGRDHGPGGADPVPCCVGTGAASYPDLVLAHDCLRHYWPANEPSGSLQDQVDIWHLARTETHTVSSTTYPGYGTAGPLTELPALTSVVNAGIDGVADGHDGVFSYLFSDAPDFFTDRNEFTIEMWAYLDAYPPVSTSYLLDISQGDLVSNALVLRLFGDTLYFVRGSVTINDTDAFPLEEWQHLVVTYDGDTLSLYRQGALVDSAAATTDYTVGGNVGFLNKLGGPAYAPLNGRGAQLALYDCALTPAEIAGHHAAQTSGGEAAAGDVLTSDGEGGFSFQPLPETGGVTPTDTTCWMPLTTVTGGVPELVWGADDSLIPTFTPI